MGGPKRLLVITYSYAPATDPRAFRWSAICNYWANKGITVDVVCVHSKIGLPQTEVQDGVNVVRVKDPSMRFRPSTLEKHHDLKSDVHSINIRQNLLQSLVRLLKKITIMTRWPDFAWLAIPGLYGQSKKLMVQNNYDGIYSVALPFSTHVVAWLLGVKRKDIPWVCDYGDPFCFLKESPLNNHKLYGFLNRYIEKKIISSSKKISVTTLETAQCYANYLKVNDHWFYHIPPLMSKIVEYKEEKRAITNSDKDEIKLIFAGTLYRHIRNPRFLLALLETVRQKVSFKLSIHFYGVLGDCKNEFEPFKDAINDWIYAHGSVEKTELLELYRHMDVLVNIGNVTTYQAPSKLVEYMATGLPILNVASVTEDSSRQILQSYPSTFSICEQDLMNDEVISNTIQFLTSAKRVPKTKIKDILKPYQCEAIAESYLNLLS